MTPVSGPPVASTWRADRELLVRLMDEIAAGSTLESGAIVQDDYAVWRRFYQHFFLGQGNALVLVLFLFAVGLICGFLADRYRQPVLAILTAAAGASATLTGLGQVWPSVLGFLQQPITSSQSWVATGAWIVLTVTGWLVQRSWLKSKSEK